LFQTVLNRAKSQRGLKKSRSSKYSRG